MSSLGTLTIDLIAKSAKYTEGLNQAARATERHTKEMQRSLRQLERQAEAAQTAFKAALVGGITVGAVKSLLEIGDNYKAMGERVKMATNSVVEYEYAQKRLLNSANTSFRSLAEAQELFIATSDNLRGGYGYTLEQALDVTDSLSFAFVRNATAADKAKTAINVYDRALATGKLTAQDWQSINSAVPTLAKNIGDAMGKTAQEINKMGMSGQLATSMMNDGLLKAKQENEDAANSMFNTIADATIKLNNEFQALWGGLNDKMGASSGVANGIIKIADNLEVVLVPAFALAGLGATKMATSLLTTSGSAAKATFKMHKLAGATNAVAAAQTGLSAVSRAASLFGGIPGILSLVVSGMAAYWMMSKDVTTANREMIKSSLELKDSFNDIESSLTSMTAAQLEKTLGEQEELRRALKAEISDVEKQLGFAERSLRTMSSANNSMFGWGQRSASAIREQERLVDSLSEKAKELKDSYFGVEKVLGSISKQFKGIKDGTELSGKALDVFENLNKQSFMLLNTGSDAELMYQRQHGYLKDISAEQFKQIKARQLANDLLQSANDREKELESILSSVNEQYNNMGLSTHQVMLNRLLDLEVSLEQFAVIKAMIGAIEDFEANKPKTGGKSSLNYFDDKLKSINEEIYKMKSINDSIQLLGGESKYTAVSELTTEFNNQNSVLANISAKQREILMLQAQELDSQKQINEILTLRNDYDKSFEDMHFELSLVGQSQRAIEELTFARELEKRAKEMSIGMSAENVAALNSEIERVLALRAEYTNLKDIIDGNPVEGISEGYKKFLDDAGTVRDQWSEATQFAFNGMTDAFASFASGTQTSFRDMTASILRDLSKILIQAAMVNTLKNASGGGGFLGTIAGWLGYADGGLVGAKSYSTGGYTGIGSKYQEAGIVHKDEFVMSKEATNYLGVDYLNALHNSAKNRKPLPTVVRSYATGGAVGGTSSSAIFAENQSSPINLNLVVYSDGSAEVDASKDGKAIESMVKVSVRKEISNQLRQRGALAR